MHSCLSRSAPPIPGLAAAKMSDEKITVHSIPDLKNSTDDALVLYLNSIHFRQSYQLTDVRIALSAAASVIAAATFYFDYTFGFDKTKQYTTVAVIVYFAINGFLTFWIWAVEKGNVYQGTHKRTGARVSFTSNTEKHAPIYELQISYFAPKSKLEQKYTVTAPFMRWFTGDGHFEKEPFRQWVATEVTAVGEADPTTVRAARNKGEKVDVRDMGSSSGAADGRITELLDDDSGEDIAATSAIARKSKKERRA